ncbi:serine/threonine-protein kinase [Saccharothrix variisporea]|uniref:non-specific serine/threonine protein kinase n=1 Tax=Saccharothrix variisporea TaxID=543527 RepID=A0A495XM79_9PSEU|nr:serine/threonine-protein kinase [Saccharothrix variisporea]RKT75012.1 protein kinase-like protein [Saccharothrix variisporea]
MRSGDVIAGRYRLEDLVGAGGMGVVWRATDLELRRVVALKRAGGGDGEDIRREARIGAGLHHPHVISVFDAVVEDEQRWLVMEYLPARSLAEITRADGPLAPDEAGRVGAQIATALAAMHAKGMVHRDVTPANVLVTEEGTAKLADLGVASWGQVTFTGTERTAGTPGYLAPETVAGLSATPATDVYALGVTLSTAVEGHPRADPRLAGVLARMTDRDPDRRPGAEQAARLLTGSGRAVSRRLLLTGGLGVAAALVATYAVTSSRSGGTSAPGGASAPGGTPTGGESRRQGSGLLPADGQAKLLYGVGDQINTALAFDLVRDAPVRMLTTNYHKPGDLTKLQRARDTLIADAYAQGYALHVVVANWEGDDPEIPVDTKYGVGCGRPHPLSPDFLRHMRTLARTFAGRPDGPPLYVTLFNEVNKFACVDGSYAANPQTTAYYDALQDHYLEARQAIREEAPNALVAMGWDAWQANDDDPSTGAGPAMFERFADTLAASDFQSVLAKQPDGNVERVRGCVRALGTYGPVMVAAYGNQSTPAKVVTEDVWALLTDESIAELVGHRLFAWNFNTDQVLAKAGQSTVDYVKDVVRRTGREPR